MVSIPARWPALLLMLVMPLSAAARPEPPRMIESCGGLFDLCGFKDRQTGEIVIPQTFERVLPFSDGLAAVRVKGRYGYIDTKGDMIIAPSFDLAGGFAFGMAEVLIGDHAGVIDRQGAFLVKPQFARIVPFTKDVLLAREGTWNNQFIRGREQLPGLKDGAAMFYEKTWGLYHVEKGWLTERAFSFSKFDETGRGPIWATKGDYIRGPFGLMRADGTWQVEPQFTHVQQLMDERAIVRKPDPAASGGSRQSELWGAVDPEGNLVVPFRTEALGYWRGGFGLTKEGGLANKNGKEGLVDKAGKLVGGRLFDKVKRSEDGARVMVDGKWVRVDQTGRFLGPDEGDTVLASCDGGGRILRKLDGYQLQGADGKPTIAQLLDYVRYFDFSCKHPTAIRIGADFKPDARWSFVRPTNGELLFDPPPFEAVSEFLDGVAMVKRGGKWGLLAEDGKFLVEPQFEEIKVPGAKTGVNGNGVIQWGIHNAGSKSATDLFEVKKDGRTYAITTTGEERPLPPVSDPRSGYLACNDGSRMFEQNGRWGIENADGKQVLLPKYRGLHCFTQGIAWAANDNKKQWCPIDPDGSDRTEPPCVQARYPYYQTHSYPEQFAKDPYENSVLWTRAFLEYGAGKREAPPRMIGDNGNGGTFSTYR